MPITTIDARKVIESGIVVLNDEKTTVGLKIFDLDFVIFFKSDSENTATSVDLQQPNEKSMTLNLLNWENAMGTAWEAKVGNIENADLYLTIASNIVGSRERFLRQFAYTFYLESKP